MTHDTRHIHVKKSCIIFLLFLLKKGMSACIGTHHMNQCLWCTQWVESWGHADTRHIHVKKSCIIFLLFLLKKGMSACIGTHHMNQCLWCTQWVESWGHAGKVFFSSQDLKT